MSYNSGLPTKFVSVSHVTASISGKNPKIGEVAYDSSGNKYVYVYNACNSQILPTYGVIVVSGASGHYSVSLTSVAETDICVGVVKHATIPTANYGYVLTKGIATIEAAATSGTIAALGLVTLAGDGAFGPVSGTGAPSVGKASAGIVSGASGSAYIQLY